ncbi:Transposable element P transposase, partial [Frankliniella fusca]
SGKCQGKWLNVREKFSIGCFCQFNYSLDAVRIVSPPACLSVKRKQFGSPLGCMIGERSITRVDHFCRKFVLFYNCSELFWNFLKKVLIISHRNADVERGLMSVLLLSGKCMEVCRRWEVSCTISWTFQRL